MSVRLFGARFAAASLLAGATGTDLTLSGDLEVDGATVLGGALDVAGATALDALTVAGAAAFNGDVTNLFSDLLIGLNQDTAGAGATDQLSYAIHVGRAPRKITTIELAMAFSAAMSGVTWAEFAVFSGNWEPTSGTTAGTPELTTAGWVSVAAEVAAVAVNGVVKKTVTPGTPIAAGTEIWLGFAVNASGLGNMRVVGSDLYGRIATRAGTRPSTMGAGSAFTGSTLAAPIAAPYLVGNILS